jgi:mutator protein MutT
MVEISQNLQQNNRKKIGVAIIYDGQGRILIDRRLAKGLMGGLWEFPGGKIEAGETPEECIRREILEELGIEVTVGSHLMTIEHDYNLFSVTLIVHHCYHRYGKPQPLCCEEIRWVTPEQLFSFNFPEANLQIVEALQQSQSSQ